VYDYPMADKIESMYRISTMNPIEGYSKKEIAEKIKKIEQQSQEYQLERTKFLSQFPDKDDELDFAEELGKLVGEEIKKTSSSQKPDEEKGYILDIGSK